MRSLKRVRVAHFPLKIVKWGTFNIRTAKTFTVKNVINKGNSESEVSPQMETPYVMEERNYKCKEGEVYSGFYCERTAFIPDFNLMSYTLRHVLTGTEFWHLDTKDNHNVFSINFRTPPPNSTGIAHVLEHLTLCGSNKYSIRDPFFKMLNRSVATSVNALTGADYTMFPFSSRNEKDFRNIQSIYLDAVFRPSLLYFDFIQEGWRIEHKDLRNPNSELMFKGVVYNEMKGIFSENFQLLRRHIYSNLMPDHIYKYVAGGDPLEIPKLNYEDVIAFHRNYYHPSNARIFSYGSFDIMKTLSYVDKEYLSNYSYKDSSHSRTPPNKRWLQPRRAHISCRPNNNRGPSNMQHQIAIALLLCDRTDVQEVFELNVLSKLLTQGPNASLYKNLIASNFSGGYNKNTGLGSECRDTYFVVGLQDIKSEDFNMFTEIFEQTLQEIIRYGFDPENIENTLHTFELFYKKSRPNFGNTFLFQSTPLWNHEGDIIANLQISEMIAKLKSRIHENKEYLQQKIAKYFADNTHKLTITMSPDALYESTLKLTEKILLLEKISKFNNNKLEKLYQESIKLEALQKNIENTDILPCLSLVDVQEPVDIPQVEEFTIENVPTQICKLHNSDITYFKCIFSVSGLTEDELMLAPLFCYIINEMGTQNHDFRQLDKLVRSKTAGFAFETKVVENINDCKSYYLGVMMTTYALNKYVPDMFAICEELLLNFSLDDTDRLEMLIENYISKISIGIASSGDLYAMRSSSALVTNAAKLKSLFSGIDHIEFMKEYNKQNRTLEIRDRLKNLGSKIFSNTNMRSAINSTPSFLSKGLENYSSFLKKLPTHNMVNKENNLCLLKPGMQNYAMNTTLYYCAKTFFAVPYMHEDHPVLRVLAKFISSNYLLPIVREQNGAYGSGARISFDGLFNFYSYRDPHSAKTLNVFDKTYDWLNAERHKLDQQKLLEAKLGVLQLVDWPEAPGDYGINNFVYRYSHEMYSTYRSRVLAVTIDDLQIIIDKYFKEEPKHYGKFILGPQIEAKFISKEEQNPI